MWVVGAGTETVVMTGGGATHSGDYGGGHKSSGEGKGSVTREVGGKCGDARGSGKGKGSVSKEGAGREGGTCGEAPGSSMR